MSLNPGTRLGSYEITSLLGSGGMGEVYRAKDLKLGRDVAIKVLQEELASDPERLRRFEQEARSASALNHPNIITIYDIGKHGSTPYIAMEFVEGKTLREILGEGPLPTKKLLPLATQIAEGLAKAHSAGIVHRDLKPENLMVTSDGYVKILDFGLAKLMPESYATGSNIVTLTKAGTREGVVLGTVQYMSPEQAAGRAVDYRSDQFSLGSILHEMATGKLAFQRETVPQTLSAIIEQELKPLVELCPNLPNHLTKIVDRCLAKDPEGRYDSTRDLARDLKSVEVIPPVQRVRTADESKLISSLVVLPLANLSPDPKQEYFSDGMTEALITDLAKISALKVISRTSAMHYKNSDKTLPEIARELNVDAVVEGSVLRAEDRVRITAQLIKADTDEHLWAESYERDLRDVLSLQSEVARTIAKEVKVKLTVQEKSLLARARPVIPEAHDAYLRGRYHWNKRSPEGFRRAIEHFQKAIELQPSHAAAYSGLADTYVLLGFWGFLSPSEVMPQAKSAAAKALELDEMLAEAHTSLGWIRHIYDWDWSAAERELKLAIELNPSYATAHFWYSIALISLGRQGEGMAEIKRAQELDPLSVAINAQLAWPLIVMRRYDEAIEQCKKTLEIGGNTFVLHYNIWMALHEMGMYEEALAEAKQTYTLMGNREVVKAMEDGYKESGYKGAMKWAIRTLAAQSKSRYVSPYTMAFLCSYAEEKEQAFEWLEKAYKERDPVLIVLRVVPYWDPFRSDPRFQDLLRRMNFPE
jgi:serine/threonine-protein kinase